MDLRDLVMMHGKSAFFYLVSRFTEQVGGFFFLCTPECRWASNPRLLALLCSGGDSPGRGASPAASVQGGAGMALEVLAVCLCVLDASWMIAFFIRPVDTTFAGRLYQMFPHMLC